MNHRNRLTILMALTTIAIIGLSSFITKSNARPPTTLPIGDPSIMQRNGYDSNPTAGSEIGTPVGLVGTNVNARDGSLETNVNWRIGGAATGVTVGIQVNTFENTPPVQFPIGWLDIKVDYGVPIATVDDRYRIVYNVAPEADPIWHDLQPYSTAIFPAGFSGQDSPRAFTNVPEPNDGVWTWTDVANLRVRVESQRVGTGEDGFPLTNRRINVFEVWATVYEGAYPAPNTLSIQPPLIGGLGQFGFFYIDILATNIVNGHGFEVHITYDTNVLTAFEFFTYTPYLLASPSQIDDTLGRIDLAYSSFLGDSVGITGDTPVARVYFFVDVEGSSPIHFESAIMSDVFGNRLNYALIDGFYGVPPVPEYPLGIGLILALAPAIPIIYKVRTRSKRRVD